MADVAAGTLYTVRFTVYDLDGAAKTGLVTGDFTKTLKRRTTGTFATSSETLAFAEIGSGVYSYSFTPTGDGYVYWLSVVEGTYTLSQQLTHDFFVVVGASATGASSADAFASVSDVQAEISQTFSTSTVPTTQNVTDFLALRASEVEALMAQHAYNYTVPSGDLPLSGDTSAKGDRMNRLARSANILGASADALFAAEAANRGMESQRSRQKMEEYKALMEVIAEYLSRTRTGTSSKHSYTTTTGWEPDTVF